MNTVTGKRSGIDLINSNSLWLRNGIIKFIHGRKSLEQLSSLIRTLKATRKETNGKGNSYLKCCRKRTDINERTFKELVGAWRLFNSSSYLFTYITTLILLHWTNLIRGSLKKITKRLQYTKYYDKEIMKIQ